MRLFVAVEVPAEVKKTLAEVISGLARAGADVKWVEERNLHFTLKFLGEVPVERVPEVEGALRAVVDAGVQGPFPIKLREMGAFPSARRPRVIWVGVGEGREQLVELASAVEGKLAGRGFPREDRPFSPHLTLGRVRSPVGTDHLVTVMEKARLPSHEMMVEEIVLFESILQRTGPLYTAKRRFRLEP